MTKYIIGTGTGRSGTTFLAKILNNCKECNIKHELRTKEHGSRMYNLSWEFNEKEAQTKLLDLKDLEGSFVGEVAFYYPNYLEWFAKKLPNLRVVEVWRDKEKMVKSFMKFFKVNHWLSYSHPKWRYSKDTVKSMYDKSFPKMDNAKDKEEAIGLYWEYHRKLMQQIMLNGKVSIYSVNIEELNKEEEQYKLFDWLKIPRENQVFEFSRSK